MPLIKFICDDCGELTSEIFFMREKQIAPKCPKCGSTTTRDWRLNSEMPCGDKERISTALGVHQSQIDSGEVFKIHPGARFNHNGYMILKNRAEQKQRLKERGWTDYRSY